MKIVMDNITYQIENTFHEGSEFDLMCSIKPLLENRRVKNIFIDYPSNKKINLTPIIDYVEQFGYGVFQNDQLLKREEQTAGLSFTVRMRDYTQRWNKIFIENTAGLKINFVLEIGCFEGLTSNYICDNLLKNDGRLICVDPLEDVYTYDDDKIFIGQYDRFIKNTRGRPIELVRKYSQDAFAELNNYRFDLIYIDGDHREDSVYRDATLYFNCCKKGTIVIFDDYNGYKEETKRGIDRFLSNISGKYDVMKSNYQLMIKIK